MYDKKTRNKNLLKKIISIVTAVIAVIVSDLISGKWFHDSFGFQTIFFVIFLIFMIPILSFIEKKIDAK